MPAVNDFRISQVYEDDVKMTRFRLNDGWDYVWIVWHNSKGFLSITSSFGVWSHIWSAMGEGYDLKKFFLNADKYYLSAKLYGPDDTYFNADQAIKDLKKELLKDRRELGTLDCEARLIWNDIEEFEADGLDDHSSRDLFFREMQSYKFLSDWMSEPWEYSIGMKPKGDFLALRDHIIPMIKDHFREKVLTESILRSEI